MSHGSRVRGCCEPLTVHGACRTRVNSGRENTVRARGGGQLWQCRNSQEDVDRNPESECRLPNPSLGEGVEVFAHPRHAGLQRAREQ